MEPRNAALRAAERMIVDEVAETAFSRSNMTALAPLMRDYQKYIQTSQVMNVSASKTTTTVEVECFVKRGELLRDGAELLSTGLVRPPTVLVLLTEHIASAETATCREGGAAEASLVKGFEDAKFDVVDRDILRAAIDEQDLVAMITGDLDAAKRLVRQTVADVVVLGESKTEAVREVASGNMLKNKGSVSVRIFRNADDKLVETLGQEAVVHSVDPLEGGQAAIENASQKLSKELVLYAIVAATSAPASHDIIVTIEKPGERSRFDSVLERLKAISTGDVEELFYSQSLARVRVAHDGSLAGLVDGLAAAKYDGSALETRQAVEHSVVVRFSQ